MRSVIQRVRTFPDRASIWRDRLDAFEYGQTPRILFISCADSRVVPSLITGSGPGELFEFRNAGNIVPAYTTERPCAASATIEYAVNVLEVRDVVVCGHSHCGAVGAVVRRDDLSKLPAVSTWLRRNGVTPDLTSYGRPGDPSVTGPAQRHLIRQLARLRSYPEIQNKLEMGVLQVHGWFYEVHTGVVTVLRNGTFQAI